MALIKCPECRKSVSDRAAACPECGYPITIAHAKKPDAPGLDDVQTVEQTSKRLKLITLVAMFLMLVGLLITMQGCPSAMEADAGIEGSRVGPVMAFIGLLIYIVNKIRIWWYHK